MSVTGIKNKYLRRLAMVGVAPFLLIFGVVAVAIIAAICAAMSAVVDTIELVRKLHVASWLRAWRGR